MQIVVQYGLGAVLLAVALARPAYADLMGVPPNCDFHQATLSAQLGDRIDGSWPPDSFQAYANALTQLSRCTTLSTEMLLLEDHVHTASAALYLRGAEHWSQWSSWESTLQSAREELAAASAVSVRLSARALTPADRTMIARATQLGTAVSARIVKVERELAWIRQARAPLSAGHGSKYLSGCTPDSVKTVDADFRLMQMSSGRRYAIDINQTRSDDVQLHTEKLVVCKNGSSVEIISSEQILSARPAR